MSTSSSRVKALLRCALCSSLLHRPTTLHCGHTVCAAHVTGTPSHRAPQHATAPATDSYPFATHDTDAGPSRPAIVHPACPIQTCNFAIEILGGSQTTAPQPRAVTPTSPPLRTSFSFTPAPPNPAHLPSSPKVPRPKIDVTLSKVLSLVASDPGQAHSSAEGLPTGSKTADKDADWDSDRDALTDLKPAAVAPAGPDASSSPTTASAAGSSTGTVSGYRSRSTDSLPSPKRVSESNADSRKRPRGASPAFESADDYVSASTNTSSEYSALFEDALLTELTCEICFTLLFEPVTTLCQHTFCAECLQRSMDHGAKCPLCRHDLHYSQFFARNKILLSILHEVFPDEYPERKIALEQGSHNQSLDTPIFVCQLSFPGMPTLLHFFEPRYRLMLRRCLESPTPRFGMVMAPRTSTGREAVYGTMLDVEKVHMLPDGRSMVATRGSFRFRILERGMLDGYVVGRIERIDDFSPEVEEEFERTAMAMVFRSNDPQIPGLPVHGITATAAGAPASGSPSVPLPRYIPTEQSNEELLAICHSFIEQLRNGVAPWVVQRLNNSHGPMPEDLGHFTFWMALVLPIDEYEKAKLLPIRSPRLRLQLIVHWIEALDNNWWFNTGCIIG
ncbi:hypothetical protein BOTBODRAFT_26778 [Botryobasidium botryosum FD-172 SS1]|uniref:RING-type domain-containing protein n=1 Tax=Botryobasidium botryosum (strain FD-172 SS1) TaxID=930990 RepID=A0A067NAF8_BOTB1|nr:hypothetical protein BOTBODRAFT_26778 [Botryobasidium botryosum FD-172 SS1]